MPLDEALKQSHRWATYEAERTNRPQDLPTRHPDIDKKGKLKKYPAERTGSGETSSSLGSVVRDKQTPHPLYRPKEDEVETGLNRKNDPEAKLDDGQDAE